MLVINMQVLMCVSLVNYLILNLYGLPVYNTTVEDYGVSTASKENDQLSSEYPVMSSSNCSFIDESDDQQSNIDLQMKADSNLLVFNINFTGWSVDIPGLEKGNIYKPTRWLRPHGRLGKQLLLLRHNFNILSLSTLSWNIHEMDISLIQSNPNCTNNIHDSIFEIDVREYLWNNLMKSETDDPICNIHITDNKGDAEFAFKCCRRVKSNITKCEYLTRDIWLNILFTIIKLLKWCAFLAGPLFIPSTLYGLQRIAHKYRHFLGNTPFNLKVLVTSMPNSYPDDNVSIVNHMPRFKENARRLKQDVVHNLKVTQINMKIRQEDLVPEHDVPVGLLSSLYDSFVRCKIRKRQLVSDCCNSGICTCPIPCYKCFRILMRIFIVCILGAPLLLRAYLYYIYEHAEMITRKNAALRQGLRFNDEDNFLFLLFIFIYLLILYCIIGCLSKSAQQRCLFVFQKCFRNMSKRNILGLLERSFSLLLKKHPFSGVKELCKQISCWIFKLILVTIIIACYIVPTINLSVNLLGHLIDPCIGHSLRPKIHKLLYSIKKELGMLNIAESDISEIDEQEILETKHHRIIQILSIFFSLIFLEAGLYLMMEISSFVVDVAVYTFLGIILNAKTTLTYLSLIFLFVMYANSCFSHVVNRYMSFNKTLSTLLLELSKKDIEEITCLHGDQKGNVAISVKTDNLRAQNDFVPLVKTKKGLLKYRTSKLVLFLGKNYEPFIPKNFFFKACTMPYYSCPGELLFNYLPAIGELIIIVAFLLIVLVIVLSFGETYQLSMSNQLLATLAGGFLPWILTKVMSRTRVSHSFDKSNINFKKCISELLDKYEQDWLIDDILLEDIEIAHEDGESPLAINQVDLLIDVSDVTFSNDLQPLLPKPYPI
ncbi:hypothetical protein CHS0354_017698 [Potamilus streckersoni]|uniref:Uncharacterized protein n=1 Tax=Potamilus streckersoni TaxID=2493646 RepID=A0AAE0RU63_9BIVA|nr:hypothetical protein CHS0354_017698 [Potamilus streckersoni]